MAEGGPNLQREVVALVEIMTVPISTSAGAQTHRWQAPVAAAGGVADHLLVVTRVEVVDLAISGYYNRGGR